MFAAEIRCKRVDRVRAFTPWHWHLDEVFVKINGQTHDLWRAVDHEDEVLESYVTKTRDKAAALKFIMKRKMQPFDHTTAPRKISSTRVTSQWKYRVSSQCQSTVRC
jgi:transposase-like protein